MRILLVAIFKFLDMQKMYSLSLRPSRNLISNNNKRHAIDSCKQIASQVNFLLQIVLRSKLSNCWYSNRGRNSHIILKNAIELIVHGGEKSELFPAPKTRLRTDSWVHECDSVDKWLKFRHIHCLIYRPGQTSPGQIQQPKEFLTSKNQLEMGNDNN